jgi:hypothetical protein
MRVRGQKSHDFCDQNRRKIERPESALRAASCKGQRKLDEKTPSNQQDLIGEMETDGQQKTSPGPGFLGQVDCRPRKIGSGQCYEGCPELLTF